MVLDRPSTKVTRPPGGASSIVFGAGPEEEPQQRRTGRARVAPPSASAEPQRPAATTTAPTQGSAPAQQEDPNPSSARPGVKTSTRMMAAAPRRRVSRFAAPLDDDEDIEGDAGASPLVVRDSHGTFVEGDSWAAPAAAVAVAARPAVRTPEAVPEGSSKQIVWRTQRTGDAEARAFAEAQRKRLEAEERRRHEKEVQVLAEQTRRLAEELLRVLTVDNAAIAGVHSAETAKIRAHIESACKRDAAAVADAKRRLGRALEGGRVEPSKPRAVEISLGRVSQREQPSTEETPAAPAAAAAAATTTTEPAPRHGRPKSAPSSAITLPQQQQQQPMAATATTAAAATEFKAPQPLQRRNSGVSAASAHTAMEAHRAAQSLVATFAHASHVPTVAAMAQKTTPPKAAAAPSDDPRVAKTAPFLVPTPPVPPSPFSLSPAQSPVHTPSFVPVPVPLSTPVHRPMPQPAAAAQSITDASPAALRPVPDAPAIAPIPTPEIAPSPIDVQRSNPSSPAPPSPSRPPPSPFVLHHGHAPSISGTSQTAAAPPAPPRLGAAPMPSPAEPTVRPLATPISTPSGSPFVLSVPSALPPSISLSTRVQLPASSPALPIVPGPQQQPAGLSARDDRAGPSPQVAAQLPPKPTLHPAPTPPVPASPFGLMTEPQSLSARVSPAPASASASVPHSPTSNAEGSDTALREAAHSADVMRRVDSMTVEPRVASEYKKRIRLAINQISADEQQVTRKIDELGRLLDEVQANQPLHRWCLRELARGIVAQGDDQVAQCQGSAFCIAAVAVGIAARFTDFSEVLIASFHEACVYTVPFHPRRLPEQTKEQYMATLGFRAEGSALEPFEAYAKRTAGIVSLYGAFMQTRMPNRMQHPRGIDHAWEWLARMLNMKPISMGPTVILSMLETAGSDLHNHYGTQFMKLLRAVMQYADSVKPTPNIEASLARLREFVSAALRKGSVSSHPEARIFLR